MASPSPLHICKGTSLTSEIRPVLCLSGSRHRVAPCSLPRTHYQHITQGFPHYYTFVGFGGDTERSWKHSESLMLRYRQVGNAVPPPMAAALGRCLGLAAAGLAGNEHVAYLPDPEYMQACAFPHMPPSIVAKLSSVICIAQACAPARLQRLPGEVGNAACDCLHI